MVSLEFTKVELEKFLSKRLIAKIATKGLDGFPHVVPIWFIHDKGVIFIATSGHSTKVRNIKGDPKVSVLIDAANEGYKVRGVLFRGHAEIVEGQAARKINERIHRKYMGIEALRNPKLSDALSGDDTTIKVESDSMVSWDFTKLAVSRVKGLALQF
jgi:PPOX class probable F420-dependent enzyme